METLWILHSYPLVNFPISYVHSPVSHVSLLGGAARVKKMGFMMVHGNNSHTVRWHITPMIMDTYPLAKWSSAL